ncbi:MAG: hypothetical protein ACOCVF_00725 [bacterium]
MSDKKSIIKEALSDYNQILETAELSARQKIAKEFPDKFKTLLDNEISNRLHTKTKISENTDKNVDDMKKENKTDSKKVKKNQINETTSEPDTETFTINELEDGEETADKLPDNLPTDVPDETPEMAKAEEPVDEPPKDLEGSEGDTPEPEVGKGEETDDILNILLQLKQSIEDLTQTKPETGDGEVEVSDIDKELDDIANSANDDNTGVEPENNKEETVDETMSTGDLDSTKMSEQESEITDDEIEAALNDLDGFDDDIEEGRGVGYNVRRTVSGRNLPKYDHLSKMEKDQTPVAIRESRVKKLVSENKKLTKKFNDLSKKVKKDQNLFENYKTALEKYRNLLSEMAIFNTNLSHVNGLLVNENIVLSHDDKVNIINEFKEIKTIDDSKTKYNSVLKEMVEKKPVINEDIDKVVNTSVQPSAKENLVETTIYENDESLQRMKKISQIIESRKR